MNLSVLYRGPLTSCNYGCSYCPFAKRTESAARLARDQSSLGQFADWLSEQAGHHWRILFTPWGEALVRQWYREALARLTHVAHIESVAAQTNLTCGLDWLDDCRPEKLALWATFHPTEIERDRFVRKVRQVRERGVRLSVGMVGAPEAFTEMTELRRELPPDVYLWVNAQQPRPRPYSSTEIEFLSSIDPHFGLTSRPQQTQGRPCRTGETSFTVDGDGQMRRCHFVDEVIGNIHDPDWVSSLRTRACPNRSCHCFLGLSHFEPLQLDQVFGHDLLVRIPTERR